MINEIEAAILAVRNAPEDALLNEAINLLSLAHAAVEKYEAIPKYYKVGNTILMGHLKVPLLDIMNDCRAALGFGQDLGFSVIQVLIKNYGLKVLPIKASVL